MTGTQSLSRATLVIAFGIGVGIGCGQSDPDGDDMSSGAAANGAGTNTGGTGAGGRAGSMIGSGGASTSGSGGSHVTGQAGSSGSGSGGKSSSGTGGVSAGQDAGTASGCRKGEETIDEGATVPAGDGCNSCTCHDGALQCTLIDCAPAACVVAKHLDDCCGAYEAVSTATLALDECLVAYPASGVDASRAQACLAKSPVNCALVDCAESRPPSRVAMPDGMGGCRYGDECSNSEDCVLAQDSSACCACVESVPAALLESNHCLMVPGTAQLRPAPAACPTCTQPVQCGACQPPPESASCLILDSFSICQ